MWKSARFLSGGSGFRLSGFCLRCRSGIYSGIDEGDRYSEVNKAAKVAEKAGLKHHVKIISKQEFWDALPDVMYHMDEPLGDASAVALYFLSKEAAGHVKVVLSGEGADELFGGYNIYREPEALKKVAWIPIWCQTCNWKTGCKAARCERTGFPYPRRNESRRTLHRKCIYLL